MPNPNNDSSIQITQKSNYIPAFDGIRAIAILLVLFSHSVIYHQFNSLRNIGLNLGYTGVSIFFVLSGYLITRLLIQEEEKNGKISLKFFYIRRAFRLLPALWLYLLVVFVLWTAGLLPNHPWHSFLSSLLYIRNLIGSGHETDHIWSLSLEQQFYFLWPIVILILPNKNNRRFLIALGVILFVLFWRYYALSHNLASYGNVYVRTDFRIDSPLIGSSIALLEKIQPKHWARINTNSSISDTFLLFSTILLSCWIALQLKLGTFWWIDSTVISLIAGILIITQLSNCDSLGRKFLTLPPLLFIGKISYGIYLWQALFLGDMSSPLGFMRKYPINLILIFVAAWLSYSIVERPFLHIKNKKFHK